MLANLSIPGVYVQEIRTLPPSVAAVPTAIPAFIGYTELIHDANGVSLVDVPTRISSQRDYEALFGFGPRPDITSVTIDATNNFITADVDIPYHLYDAIRLFYANGGGECYIVSVGRYATDGGASVDDFNAAGQALDQIARIDEPTILLFPDAVKLTAANLGAVQQSALLQCGELQDRFTICDCREDDPQGTDFRDNVGINNIKYGAAYTPWLSVRLDRGVDYGMLRTLTIQRPVGGNLTGFNHAALHDGNTEVTDLMTRYDLIDDVDAAYRTYIDAPSEPDPDATALNTAITALRVATDADADGTPTAIGDAQTELETGITAYDTLVTAGTEDAAAISAQNMRLRELYATYRSAIEAAYQPETNLRNLFPAYRSIAQGVNDLPQATPPSGAVAGVYARVDEQRGVWKAPANESLSQVLEPVTRFNRAQLEDLNVHATSGKSINAIRAFTGKGTLIFGARTLTGNDGENRYVNVRRLLIFLEESIKKATEQFVFEPNDANTWVRVRGMIENFLNLQWRAGALQGARAQDAYRVAIGLGETMTADDVTSGRMIVSISMAPVRPAEFIILRFSQQQAQS
ncbi:MAG: phage tail sheath C-terminal domain-containing protein [Bacteroidota bacterium]